MIAQPATLFDTELDLDGFVDPTRNYFSRHIDNSRSKVVRGIEQFATESVRLPTGPRKDRPFLMDTQPWVNLLWKEFANDYWYEYATTGVTQAGKSLSTFAIPMLWKLCEQGEDVIVAAPTKEIIQDKMRRDFQPVIMASKYADMWPTRGGAAREGVPDLIKFKNGASCKLMSFESGDKAKASFTCNNQFFTEIDGEKPSQTSAESNAIEQILARGRVDEAWNRFVCLECTPSYKKGPIWQFVHHIGSASKIMCPCPRCNAWVCPDREDFKGWDQANDIIEAEENAAWHCPTCDQVISEKQRYQANLDAVLVHKGQEIQPNGKVTGPMPPTRTLGFRFSAFNNMFLSPASIGIDCYKAAHSEDEIDAEKKLTQFVFCRPYEPLELDELDMDPLEMQKRKTVTPKGVIPDGTMAVTIGMDIGKKICHWVSIAWVVTKEKRIGVIFDYDKIYLKMTIDGEKMTADDVALDMVFANCVDAWKENMDSGWMMQSGGEVRSYDSFWIDARWQDGGDEEGEDQEIIYNAVKRWQDKRVMALFGHASVDQRKGGAYNEPKVNRVTGVAGPDVLHVSHAYYIKQLVKQRVRRVHVNSDHWKEIVQRRVLKKEGANGSLVFYDDTNPEKHLEINRHISAERKVTQFEPEKGMVTKWIADRPNHYLDAIAYACAAGHFRKFRVAGNAAKGKPKSLPKESTGARVIRAPSGRSFVARKR